MLVELRYVFPDLTPHIIYGFNVIKCRERSNDDKCVTHTIKTKQNKKTSLMCRLDKEAGADPGGGGPGGLPYTHTTHTDM